jgi:phage terminase Nu1 subunit (DNA packaging protein)
LFLENRDFGFGKMQPEQPKAAVTLEALADVLGITLHAAKKALKQNLFERLQRGRYALAASVQAYHRADVESAVRRAFEATKPEDEVSVSRLGEVLGIGERWVQQLEAQGVLRKSARGRYPLAASVQAYTQFKVDSEVSRANPEETTPGERVKIERARKLKLENDERERQTVLMPDALIALDVIFGMIKAGFAGVPARVTDDVALRRRIEDGNEAVLRDLARRFRKAASAMREGRDPDAAVEEDDG